MQFASNYWGSSVTHIYSFRQGSDHGSRQNSYHRPVSALVLFGALAASAHNDFCLVRSSRRCRCWQRAILLTEGVLLSIWLTRGTFYGIAEPVRTYLQIRHKCLLDFASRTRGFLNPSAVNECSANSKSIRPFDMPALEQRQSLPPQLSRSPCQRLQSPISIPRSLLLTEAPRTDAPSSSDNTPPLSAQARSWSLCSTTTSSQLNGLRSDEN
jgi:hypothetical protein